MTEESDDDELTDEERALLRSAHVREMLAEDLRKELARDDGSGVKWLVVAAAVLVVGGLVAMLLYTLSRRPDPPDEPLGLVQARSAR